MSFTFVDNYCHGLITAEEALYPGSPALGQFYIVTDDGYELFWEALDRAFCYLGGEKFTHLQTLLPGGGAARDDGFEKFMYLAQVLDSGAEAKECLEAGVAILERLLATPSATRSGTHADAEAAAHLRSQLAAALCALAEQVYCEDEELGADAEVAAMLAECEALYARAAGVDAGSPEPLHGLANHRDARGGRQAAAGVRDGARRAARAAGARR
eukprot:PRCOL_00006462-RA